MRIISKLFISLLVLVLFLSTTALGALFFIKNNDSIRLEGENSELKNKLNDVKPTEITSCDSKCIETLTFEDAGLGIKVDYPISWKGVLTSDTKNEFVYQPIYGVIAQKYFYTLTKNSAKLKFEKILAGVDGNISGLKNSEDEYVEVSPKIIRHKTKDTSLWKYNSKADCSDMMGKPVPGEFDICIGSFFPGFGTVFVSTATIDSNDEDLLKEADKIVLSTLN